MITNIKKLLKLPIRTNNSRLKIALKLPNLNTYLICRLLKLKDNKYEYIFNKKLTMYDKVIKKVLNMNDTPSNVHCKRFITQKVKYSGEKEGYIIINNQFNNRLKNRIYSCYVNSDFLLLKFICYRECFREYI